MPRHKLHVIALFALVACLAPEKPLVAQQSAVGFVEDFALADDRASMLDQLVPGSSDFYYYSCLERQHAGKLDEIPGLLKSWIERHGRSSRVVEIENRQALLSYPVDERKSLEFLRDRLRLNFNHRQQIPGAEPDLPTALDQKEVSTSAYLARALQRHGNSLKGIRGRALERLASSDLDETRLRSLLDRLDHPDIPNLAALVLRELGTRRSRGFGSLKIHARMTLAQLEECATTRPVLLGEKNFVTAYLKQLRPTSGDPQGKMEPQRLLAYLERLEAFTKRLPAAMNSLKARVLHERLLFDQRRGVFDRDRLLAYLKLPRREGYVHRRLRENSLPREVFVEPSNQSWADAMGLARIRLDGEKLVRELLAPYLAELDDIEAAGEFRQLLDDRWLKRLFAEAKILSGRGDMERWYSLLDDPAYYEALRGRVDLDFAPQSKRFFEADERVRLDVDVKNVPNLIVKVYEINALNYYSEKLDDVENSLAVEGLVASDERSFSYEENPFLRVRRSFDFPALENPGVYIVDFIGNGIASRALIEKGRLRHVQRIGAAGHVFRVFDDAGRFLKDAAVRVDGREFEADEDGEIRVPFRTGGSGMRTIVLRHGERASLARFRHEAESYRLDAGFFVERETLLPGATARLILRPSLSLAGKQVDLSLLEDILLTITAHAGNGTPTNLEFRDLKLQRDGDTIVEFRVPDRSRRMEVKLEGQVTKMTDGKKDMVVDVAKDLVLNAIDTSNQIASPLLSRNPEGWVIDLLGRNGEPVARRSLSLSIRHRDFSEPHLISLKTDDEGRVRLGALEDIASISAPEYQSSFGTWELRDRGNTLPDRVIAAQGRLIRIPYPGGADRASRAVVSLFEMHEGEYRRDLIDKVAIERGFLVLRGLEPGAYSLRFKETGDNLRILVAAAEANEGWLIDGDRALPVDGLRHLQIVEVARSGDELVVSCANTGKSTRLHVFATRFAPGYDAFSRLGIAPDAAPPIPWRSGHAESIYSSGRKVDDEYRYILERRFTAKFAGNMLKRPGLLLNPWALDETDTAIGLGGGAGGRFGGRRGRGRRSGAAGGGAPGPGSFWNANVFANIDYLPGPSSVVLGLRPDAQGVVRIPLAELGEGHMIRVIAVDDDDTVMRSMVLPEKQRKLRDLRLQHGLDPAKHYAEQKKIEFLNTGEEAVMGGVVSGRSKSYDDLASVYRLFTTLDPGSTLKDFVFILDWPKLTREQKLEHYADHACHELHLFIHEKDPAFFAKEIRPYLENKSHRTFMDDYLLGEDLSAYTESRAFAQLNLVEQILLLKRLDREKIAARLVKDLLALQPLDLDRKNVLFMTAFALDSLMAQDAPNLAFDAAPAEQGFVRDNRARNRDKIGAAGAPSPARKPAAREKAKEERLDRNEDGVLVEELEEDAEAEPMEELERRSESQKDLKLRKQSKLFYADPGRTQRYAESNYWHLRIEAQGPELIPVNRFWNDLAAARGEDFVSPHFAEAASSFAEMMLALSLLDLPFEAGEHEIERSEERVTMTAASPIILLREEIAEAKPADDEPLLVGQSFIRMDDPHVWVEGERRDKIVRDEFLCGVPYISRIVVTNPTPRRRRLQILRQIPQGAMPIKDRQVTLSAPVAVEGYGTKTMTFAFYFPEPGDFRHYPVQVNHEGMHLAAAESLAMKVLREPSRIDVTSWEQVSQRAEVDALIAFLNEANLHRLDLTKIAWRMKDESTFDRVLALLRERRHFDRTLWSYGIRHGDQEAVRELLEREDDLVRQTGPYLDSELLDVDPIERRFWQHIDYAPLFNARAHAFAGQRKILNGELEQHYRRLMNIMAHRPRLDDDDRLAITCYLLLQDRIAEALEQFGRIRREGTEAQLQYDYMRAYLDFFTGELDRARAIAERHRDHPVERWRLLFNDVLAHLDEAAGKKVDIEDADDRDRRQDGLAAREPKLELRVENGRVEISHERLDACQVSMWMMDVEFLFSSSPFVQEGAGALAYVKPNSTMKLDLSSADGKASFGLPERLKNANLLIEVRSGGLVRRKTHFANSIDVAMMENFGQLRVRDRESKRPQARVYVKVFARLRNGKVRFHKDGYTDIRGRFDYVSLSGPGSSDVEHFALLVLSEDKGAVVREVAPPAR